ncbi:MAG: hypothetical protein K5679_01040 [Lachnospiraceae bacterium]|nr:hypothetical protein [Lachnospiraceae bacterium]
MSETKSMYTPNDIYDIENYVLLGEITHATEMGRWSIGYYYSEADDKWYVALTKGNNNSFAEPCESRERAIERYTEKAEDLKIISQRIIAKKNAGMLRTNEELKEEYFKQKTKRLHEKTKLKAERIAQIQLERKQNKEKATVAKRSSYVDYAALFGEAISGGSKRADSLWLAKNGDLIFQGEYGHFDDCYLIGTTINNIKKYYKEIIQLIHEYCTKKTGYSISPCDHTDCSNQSRRETGYIQKIVDIDKISIDYIKSLYEEAKKNNEFPDTDKLMKLKKDNDEYDSWMSETHR